MKIKKIMNVKKINERAFAKLQLIFAICYGILLSVYILLTYILDIMTDNFGYAYVALWTMLSIVHMVAITLRENNYENEKA